MSQINQGILLEAMLLVHKRCLFGGSSNLPVVMCQLLHFGAVHLPLRAVKGQLMPETDKGVNACTKNESEFQETEEVTLQALHAQQLTRRGGGTRCEPTKCFVMGLTGRFSTYMHSKHSVCCVPEHTWPLCKQEAAFLLALAYTTVTLCSGTR